MATQRDIADHLGISQPAVAGLVRDGVLTAAARGSYDVDAARLAYCAHLREQAAGRAGREGAALDLSTERARLAAAQAEAVERKNARDRGELASLPAMKSAVAQTIEVSRTRIEKVGAIVARGDAKLRGRIDVAIRDALEDLSETRILFLAGEEALSGDDGYGAD